MAAIEKITANEKAVTIRKPDGTRQTIVVRVWNETVANLTLMALGTSAPEILLSIIEIFSNNFQAGDLGPGNRFFFSKTSSNVRDYLSFQNQFYKKRYNRRKCCFQFVHNHCNLLGVRPKT